MVAEIDEQSSIFDSASKNSKIAFIISIYVTTRVKLQNSSTLTSKRDLPFSKVSIEQFRLYGNSEQQNTQFFMMNHSKVYPTKSHIQRALSYGTALKQSNNFHS